MPDALTNWTEWAAIAQFVAAGVLTVSAGALIAPTCQPHVLSVADMGFSKSMS